MKVLAFILILVAVLDMSWSVVTLIPERKLVKQAWRHDKKQFAKLIYSSVCDILAVMVFIAYLAS